MSWMLPRATSARRMASLDSRSVAEALATLVCAMRLCSCACAVRLRAWSHFSSDSCEIAQEINVKAEEQFRSALRRTSA